MAVQLGLQYRHLGLALQLSVALSPLHCRSYPLQCRKFLNLLVKLLFVRLYPEWMDREPISN